MWWDDLGDRGLPREADMQALRLAHLGNPGRLEQTEEGPLPASQRDLFDAGDGGDDGPDVWPLCECGFAGGTASPEEATCDIDDDPQTTRPAVPQQPCMALYSDGDGTTAILDPCCEMPQASEPTFETSAICLSTLRRCLTSTRVCL